MNKEDNFRELLKNEEFITENMSAFKEYEVEIVSIGEPKPYSRPRFTSRGFKHCYNKREIYMNDLRKEFNKFLTKEQHDMIEKIIKSETYYVEVNGEFYIRIPKNESVKNRALKELKIVRPIVARGDTDNYIKLVLDVLHEVVYDDDKHVVDIKAAKYYSIKPRIELKIKFKYI